MDKKILIAEDDPVVRDSICSLLEALSGLKAEPVENGFELVEEIKRGYEGYLLVFTDHNMKTPNGVENIDGVEAIRRIRAFEEQSGLGKMPIYMVSSSDKENEAIEAGADGYLSKPAGVKDFAEVLDKHLE
tara:strand:+ start:418 stop:810 length:393 start_codon:yes stop_codon:yes gene_type:complete